MSNGLQSPAPRTTCDCKLSLLALLLAISPSLYAGSRNSPNYTITADTADAGGRRATSASYTNDGSAGLIAGISTVASPSETAKHGYIAQLYDLASGISLSATPATIDEGGTRQLSAARNLDDGTGLALDPATVAWSVLGGPITGINPTGVATADTVYQNTGAGVQGVASGFTASLALTVLNVNIDNFRAYAGDTIDDAWQVLYFGLPPNPAAGPAMDPDGDGQNNRFEWIAELIPTDANSAFKLSIVRSLQGAHLIFGPTAAGRTYTVKYGFDFLDVPNWLPLPGGIVSDIGNERRVLDPNAPASPRKYYRVEIAKP